jgi:outer membrane protein TolC
MSRPTGARRMVRPIIVLTILFTVGPVGAQPGAAKLSLDVRIAPGDTLRVSLRDCIDRAIAVGEEIRIAEADLASARGLYEQVRSDVLPQLTLSGNYVRQFETIYSQEGVDFGIEPFVPDTLATLEQRVRDLENALPTAPLAGLSGLFSAGPFASEHRWDVSLGLSQKIFEGWGLQAAVRVARHGLRSYEDRLADRETEVRMLVREVYLGALLADRTAEIAELGLE